MCILGLMNERPPFERFGGWSYETFRRMARNDTMTATEQSGFPEDIRAGKTGEIFADIVAKVPALSELGTTIMDIGCGANPLTELLIAHCIGHEQTLVLIDSPEVLANLSDQSKTFNNMVILRSGYFPDMPELIREYDHRVDGLIAYSVLQYVIAESPAYAFFDESLGLLAPRGRLLIGDIPNSSMRTRFLASEEGKRFHRDYTGVDEDPVILWPHLPKGSIDDGVLLGLILRARMAGYHAWLVPQTSGLPMGNRREDLLCESP
jgi:hypothetical protein